jgi:hypothetical protein
MAIVCIAGTSPGIGKTSVAEMLLARLPGWHAARVRVADEITGNDAAILGDAEYRLISGEAAANDAETHRLLAAGAHGASVLLAQARGLAEGLKAMLAQAPAGAHILVEGNAYLWACDADVSVMVIGPGPSGKGMARARPSVRELFRKVNIWVWNARTDPKAEGFFEFPMALAKMGFVETVSNKADYHHVNPYKAGDSGNAPFTDAVVQALERNRWRPESDEFLRRAGFDV